LFEGIAETVMKTDGAAAKVQQGGDGEKPKKGFFQKIKQAFKKKD
jgi:hypothetical protein